MAKTERLFIAAPLPNPLKQAVSEWQHELKAEFSFRKWMHPEDLHITLKFLGHVETSLLEQVQERLNMICSEHTPFSLHLGVLGTFGKRAAPSILYMDVLGELEPLSKLQQRTEASILEVIREEPENRPYKPHLTLARSFNGVGGWIPERLNHYKPAKELQNSWLVDRLVLFRSHLERVPMYESVTSSPLTGQTLVQSAAE